MCPESSASIRSDHHAVGGVVTRAQIEALPLNGRNFLELAKLEPGVTNPGRVSDGRVFVSLLGAGLKTIPRVGIPGSQWMARTSSTPGTAGVIFQVSQDVVQEFQISTVNFDAVDQPDEQRRDQHRDALGRQRVSRKRRSMFYRDHHLAAYPACGAIRQPRSVLPATPVRLGRRAGHSGRTGLSSSRATSVTTSGGRLGSAEHAEFARSAESFQSLFRESVQRPRRRAPSSQSQRLRAVHARRQSRLFSGGTILPSGWSRRTNRAVRAWWRSRACCRPRS